MEPDVDIAVKPHSQTKPPSQTDHLIALRNEREQAAARDARVAKALTLAATSLGYVVVQLDVTIVNVAINSIGADFGGSVADLQWIVNAYTITFAAFILTAGALGDRLGARRVFIAALRFSCWRRSPARWRRACLS
jgi:MFS transporter, DHA2 family, methylenomycin A resistance protein